MTPTSPKIKRDRTAVVVVLSIVLVSVVMPIGIMIWRSLTPTVAIRSADAGTFISSTATGGGLLSSKLSSVQTTSGSMTVAGVFNAAKGQPLKIKDLNKDGLQLCAGDDLSTCLPMEGAWIGPLNPASESSRAFNFERFGLDGYNVGSWLVFGTLFSFLSLMMAVALSVKPGSDAEDSPADTQSR